MNEYSYSIQYPMDLKVKDFKFLCQAVKHISPHTLPIKIAGNLLREKKSKKEKKRKVKSAWNCLLAIFKAKVLQRVVDTWSSCIRHAASQPFDRPALDEWKLQKNWKPKVKKLNGQSLRQMNNRNMSMFNESKRC